MGRRKHFNLQNDFYHKLNILVTFWSSALVWVVSPWSWDSCWSWEDLPWPCTLPCSVVPLCSPIPGSVWDVRTQDTCTHENGAFLFFFSLVPGLEEKEKKTQNSSNAGFSTLVLLKFGDRSFFVVGTALCIIGYVAKSSALYPLDASSTSLPKLGQPEMSLDIVKHLWVSAKITSIWEQLLPFSSQYLWKYNSL